MNDICENCYEEAFLVKAQGMQVCKTCVSDMGTNVMTEEVNEDAILGNYDDMLGVMSDEDVLDMIRDEYVGY